MDLAQLIAAHRAIAETHRADAAKHDAIADELERPRVGTMIGKRSAPAARSTPRRTSAETRPTKGAAKEGARGGRNAVRDAIEAELVTNPDATAKDLAKALGITEGGVYYHLATLRPRRKKSA